MTDKQKQALRVLRKLLNVNGEPLITKDEWFLLFDFVVYDAEESTTITIPKDLKGTDTDGGVVGEKGEQPSEPDLVGLGELGKVWNEQAIISRLDKIIKLLESATLIFPKETRQPFVSPVLYGCPTDIIYNSETNTSNKIEE